jgi:DNA replication protein DnaC
MIKTPPRYEGAKWGDVPTDIQKFVENIRKSRKGLYIHGAVGTGKTHIAYAIRNWILEKRGRVLFQNTTELIFDIKRDFDRHVMDKMRWDERLTEYEGVLILDDIGAERVTDYVAEVFYLVVNSRYNQMLPIIFTSNLSLEELEERVGDRTASRIVEMCDVVHLDGEDKRLQIAKANKS